MIRFTAKLYFFRREEFVFYNIGGRLHLVYTVDDRPSAALLSAAADDVHNNDVWGKGNFEKIELVHKDCYYTKNVPTNDENKISNKSKCKPTNGLQTTNIQHRL